MMWSYPHVYGGIFTGFGFFSFLWFLLPIIVFILIIAAIFGSHSHKGVGGEETEKEENALSILKIRYAKGEITKRQFEEMKKDIS